MKYFASSLLLCLLTRLSFVSSSSAPFVRGLSPLAQDAAFGLSRGGGLFGGDEKAKTVELPTDPDAAKKFPAMTEDEISEILEHVPVFAVTDTNGAGVVLKPDNETSVFYFFMSQKQANATLNQLRESGTTADLELKVSAFSLGKIWFTLLNGNSSPDQEVLLKLPGASDADVSQIAKGVQYRLVPDTRDLLGARMLLTMTAEDTENLKSKDGTVNQKAAQAALKRAFEESPKFNATYNEIPVFTIAQMRMQKKPEEGDQGEPVTMLPMYFSLQQLVGTWQQFTTSSPDQLKDVEPAINLLPLKELIGLMMQESETDWRSVVLIPASAGDAVAGASPTLSTPNPEETLAGMTGDTLGDL